MYAIDDNCLRRYTVEMTEEMAAQEGMFCGGVVEFIIEPITFFKGLFSSV